MGQPKDDKDEKNERSNGRRATSRHRHHSLSGPPVRPSARDLHNTHIQEGYIRHNPWMKEENDDERPKFSLARTLPRTVRWKRDDEGEWRDVASDDDASKGETQPAPQVAAAQKQHQDQNHDQHEESEASRASRDLSPFEREPRDRNPSDASTAVASDDDISTKPLHHYHHHHHHHHPLPSPLKQSVSSESPSPTREKPAKKHRIDGFQPNNTSLARFTSPATANNSTDELDANGKYRPFNAWAAIRMRYSRPLAEWLGTTVLIFLGVSANLAQVTSQNEAADLTTVYWAWGFAAMLAIYISGGGSGGFLNPALTVMLSFYRGFPSRSVPLYVCAQVVGAFTGGLLAFAVYYDSIMHLDGALIPASTGIALYTQPREWVSPGSAFLCEFLGTAVIACAILALGDSGNSPPGAGMHAFIIGLLVTAADMCFSWNSRGCFNPCRDFGPRLAALAVGYPLSSFTDFSNWWIWGAWLGPISGAMAGGLAYDMCIFQGSESPVNYSFRQVKRKGLKEKRRWYLLTRRHGKAGKVQRRLDEDELGDLESQATAGGEVNLAN